MSSLATITLDPSLRWQRCAAANGGAFRAAGANVRSTEI